MILFLIMLASNVQNYLEKHVHEITLNNGMKWLIVENHTAPVFTGMILVKVGGVNETIGKTGLAHMLEHMAFKGTTTIGTKDFQKEKPILEEIEHVVSQLDAEKRKPNPDKKLIKELEERYKYLINEERKYIIPDELFYIYTINGGTYINAFTAKDMTAYFLGLPKNRLELFLAMEYLRITDPVFREFYEERNVVAEERLMRYDSKPQVKIYELLLASAFVAHPYQFPTIGWMDDIKNLSISDLREFYKKYYVPVNMVGLIIGDVNVEEATKLIEKYFGRIPYTPPPPDNITKEPMQEGPRYTYLCANANPKIVMAYHIPTYPNYDKVVFDIIEYILGVGKASRLYKTLVKEKQIAAAVDVDTYPGERYPHLFIIEALPKSPHSNKELYNEILNQINLLKTKGITKDELKRAKYMLKADIYNYFNSTMGLAHLLLRWEVITNNWAYLFDYLKDIDKVSTEDVKTVANKYFKMNNLTVAQLLKENECNNISF